MSQTVIELPCGASIITTKVCGRYYIMAKQIHTGKNILVWHNAPLKNVRQTRAWLKKRLNLKDWTKDIPEENMEDLYYNWYKPTLSGIHEIQCNRDPE